MRLVLLFLRFADLLGVERSTVQFRVSIHASADVEAATKWWADLVGVPVQELRRATL
jgi:hypothetical protein